MNLLENGCCLIGKSYYNKAKKTFCYSSQKHEKNILVISFKIVNKKYRIKQSNNMKKISIILLTFFLIVACKKTILEAPKNLIEEDKMIDILYDISILEAIKISQPTSLQTKGIDPKTYIYKKYKIDSLQFAKSDQYYASDLKVYSKMYQKVIDKIAAQKTKDSIANLPKTKK
jgi:hypothetical protein